ncbi:MAG: hypothetical protein QSU88_00690, partial [Candidatus Methanoperedens sp.]|nr:hypothetical protein [Candidatus Methanoperedens sp.]
LILSGILALQIIFAGAQSQAVNGENIVPEHETPVQAADAQLKKQITTVLTIEVDSDRPVEIIYPEPASTPTMRPYR